MVNRDARKPFIMRTFSVLMTICFISFFYSCEQLDPNVDKTGEDELKALEVDKVISKADQKYTDVMYVPIYSDIYFDSQNPKVLLAATLSIRNTSYNDSLYISKIDYFDTGGDLVRSFIDRPINLPPMATINYVIEKDDDTGGPGANFIVELSSASKDIKPLIQALMVGESGNKGFAFSTDAYSLKN